MKQLINWSVGAAILSLAPMAASLTNIPALSGSQALDELFEDHGGEFPTRSPRIGSASLKGTLPN